MRKSLTEATDCFVEDNAKLLKHHGTYQQDDKDHRKEKNADGTRKGKAYMFMVRTRVPGGKVTAEQFLAELDLCDRYGNGTLRITSRQGFQLHGVLKENLREAIRGINRTMLTTLAACGDVERNVMCCPAPYNGNPVRREMQEMADRVAAHLKPRTTGYYEIWLKDDEGHEIDATEFKPVEEPIYGARYLPRKFKTAFALPEDNCVEIYSNDLGFLAIVENESIVGYNVLVGGGMGVTPSGTRRFPPSPSVLRSSRPTKWWTSRKPMVKVQRDFGNREDRKVARMKYLIANWGLPKFKEKVEEYYGRRLQEPNPIDVTDVDDHIGWHDQGDGKLFLGVNIENGRIKDEGDLRIKSCLRMLLEKYGMRCRLTPLQSLILCDIDPGERKSIERVLAEHGIKLDGELSLVAPVRDRVPGLSHVRAVDHGVGAGHAPVARRARSRDGPPGPRRRADHRAHDRLPQRMCPSLHAGDRPRRKDAREIHDLCRRQRDGDAARFHLQGSRAVRRRRPGVGAALGLVQGRTAKRRIAGRFLPPPGQRAALGACRTDGRASLIRRPA